MTSQLRRCCSPTASAQMRPAWCARCAVRVCNGSCWSPVTARVGGLDRTDRGRRCGGADQTPADKLLVVRERRPKTIMWATGSTTPCAGCCVGRGRARRSRRHRVVRKLRTWSLRWTVSTSSGRPWASRVRPGVMATQAAWLGMGLCFVAMGAAALGISAAAAAILQEGIDVLAMAWALRVGSLKPRAARRIGAHDAEILARLRARPPIDAESGRTGS